MRLTGQVPPTRKSLDAALLILRNKSSSQGMKTQEIYRAATPENLPSHLLEDGTSPFRSMRYLKVKVLEDLKSKGLIEKRHIRLVNNDANHSSSLKTGKSTSEAKKSRWLWSLMDMKREAEAVAKRAQKQENPPRS